ncbi:hypothetical protein ARMSODRAFT_1003627 [Armillaria solidipes]|uniref:Uncharacterized protein n=1 Tax=Armillaria solidipes TaxID=1076256 RepID=A0A2H3BU35_9AGAR|nr:hypothetical protein ARMSODRAFT_1003627 [Armillaria solidipes]
MRVSSGILTIPVFPDRHPVISGTTRVTAAPFLDSANARLLDSGYGRVQKNISFVGFELVDVFQRGFHKMKKVQFIRDNLFWFLGIELLGAQCFRLVGRLRPSHTIRGVLPRRHRGSPTKLSQINQCYTSDFNTTHRKFSESLVSHSTRPSPGPPSPGGAGADRTGLLIKQTQEPPAAGLSDSYYQSSRARDLSRPVWAAGPVAGRPSEAIETP